ncbi:MAG TPA: trypsin-like peptidase domain-containing protein [Rhodoblastus sp.]|nr:trypsin-like peptidase domain-containing protein [Rhodoblastus sp.]
MKLARRRLLFLTVFVVALVSAILWFRTPKLERAGAIEKLLPSVVRITTHSLEKNDAPTAKPGEMKVKESYGSGFVIDKAGYIATNRHVVKGAYEIIVQLQDGAPLRARLVGHGGDVDLALLKVETSKKLHPVTFGDSNKLELGQQVVVIGNPFGLGTTVTTGVVSALNRDLGFSLFDSFIQTDAPINHGNSGGPIFDLKGQVIAVSTAYYTGGNAKGGSIGLGFAIPSETTQEVMRLLRQNGYLKVGWIGVEGASLTPELVNALGVAAGSGAVVADVVKGSPADGVLQTGDIITDINRYTLEDMRMLRREVASALGERVRLKILRGGRPETVNLVPVEWPGAQKQEAPPLRVVQASGQANDLGFMCAPLGDETREQFKIEASRKGLVVTEVQSGSPAADAGLMIGDVLASVQLRPVARPEDVAESIAQATQAKRDYIAMLVESQGRMKYLALPLKWQAPPDQVAGGPAK